MINSIFIYIYNYRINHTFQNDISYSISRIFSPLILTKMNNFIPYPNSVIHSEMVSLPNIDSVNEYVEQQRIYEEQMEQIKSVGRIIEQDEMKGIGKKLFYEYIFYESLALNFGDFILRDMIIYYRQLFFNN